MLDVDGAAVSGPTLPATAWRRFMEKALFGTPNLAFPAALSPAQFAPWPGVHGYRPAPLETPSSSAATATSSP